MANENKQKAGKTPPQYVVGRKEFCWLLAQEEGERTDDQNIELARQFTSLCEALAAADKHGASVLKIIDHTTWPAKLEEVLWEVPTIVPFPKCWWVTDHLLAGPVFFAGSRTAFLEQMDAFDKAGIRTIVSLVGIQEFFSDEDQGDGVAWEIMSRFSWHGFALPDGSAPDTATMQVILGWIDAELLGGGKVYVHCLSGRGRTGTIIGCWLARHGVAYGQGVIGRLTELREAAGLPIPCPATDSQRALIMRWRRGQ
jgi:hypothetical protein